MKADTVIVLALILSILLVFVYVGKNLAKPFTEFGSAWWRGAGKISNATSNFTSDWSEGAGKIKSGVSNFTSAWSKGFDKIKGFFGVNKEVNIESFLKTAYESDTFIFTAKNTNSEYLGLLTDVSETTRFYTIISFPEIKLEEERSAMMDYLKSQEIGQYDFNAEEYKELLIPDALMKDIEDIDHFKENKILHIHSALHDAHLDFMKIVETGTAYQPVIYQLTIAIKEK
jgi:hypothetical protein